MSSFLTQKQIEELFAGEPPVKSMNGTPDSPWYVHPAMPWENIRKVHLAGATDMMIPYRDERLAGYRDGEYNPVIETRHRLALMKGLTDEALKAHVVELIQSNHNLQREVARLRGWK